MFWKRESRAIYLVSWPPLPYIKTLPNLKFLTHTNPGGVGAHIYLFLDYTNTIGCNFNTETIRDKEGSSCEICWICWICLQCQLWKLCLCCYKGTKKLRKQSAIRKKFLFIKKIKLENRKVYRPPPPPPQKTNKRMSQAPAPSYRLKTQKQQSAHKQRQHLPYK